MERLSNRRKVYSDGYAVVADTWGLLGDKGAIVPEHRLIAALMLGRPLEHGEMVYHLDLDRANNSPDNLVVVNCSEHGQFHRGGSVVKRKKPKRQISFEGNTRFVKMKCPWCGKVFYRRRSATVLERDNSLHVNCCGSRCANYLRNAVENGVCENLSKRVRENIICEFSSNGPFMERFTKGLLPSHWTIGDDGLLHGD